jgi:hypothetical protein
MMTNPNSSIDQPVTVATTADHSAASDKEAPPSFVKLAMRNMVRQGGKSLFHFSLSTVGLLGLLVGLSYLTR